MTDGGVGSIRRAGLLIAPVALVIWWLHVASLDAKLVTAGYSVLDWLFVSSRAWPPAAYPNGAANLGASLPLHVFRWAYEWLGADPRPLMPFYMLLEVAALVAAYLLFAKAASSQLPWPAIALFVLLTAFSQLQSMNLGRFGHPSVWALYYSLGESGRLAALACALLGRWRWAIALFSLTALTHPLIALPGAVALGVIWLLGPYRPSWRQILPAVSVGLVVTAVWIAGSLGGAGVGGGGIPAADWIALTKMNNVHWYPVDQGLFGALAERQLFPLVGFLAVCVAVWPEVVLVGKRAIGAILVATGILAIAGLVVSATTASPFLIKLALHRVSELTIELAALPVVVTLWADVERGRARIRWIAAALLAFMVFAKYKAGFPLLFVVTWVVLRRPEGDVPRAWIAFAASLAILAIAGIWGLVTGVSALQGYGVTGVGYLLSAPWPALVLLATVVATATLTPPYVRRLAIPVIVAGLLVATVKVRLGKAVGPSTEAAMQMMQWAAANFPERAVAYVDPSADLGWRDIARRGSYGSAREWLHTAWIYDSRREVFDEGLRRFAELGLTVDPYLRMSNEGWAAMRAMRADVARAYYSRPPAWFKEIAARRGVYAFVLDATRYSSAYGLSPIYQNTHWVIAVPDAAH